MVGPFTITLLKFAAEFLLKKIKICQHLTKLWARKLRLKRHVCQGTVLLKGKLARDLTYGGAETVVTASHCDNRIHILSFYLH